MPSKVFPLRLPDETKTRWQQAAREQPLAEFVKDAVEEKIARLAREPEYEVTNVRIEPPTIIHRRSGDKVFKGPDPKGGKAKK